MNCHGGIGCIQMISWDQGWGRPHFGGVQEHPGSPSAAPRFGMLKQLPPLTSRDVFPMEFPKSSTKAAVSPPCTPQSPTPRVPSQPTPVPGDIFRGKFRSKQFPSQQGQCPAF